jgi:hypothetical protein
MTSPQLSHEDLDRFEAFLSSCLADPTQAASAATVHRELCDRVLASLRQRPTLSESDIIFLRSWLKARDLIVAGLQFLEMADESTAGSVRHERECTETAFDLLPRLLDEARVLPPPSQG